MRKSLFAAALIGIALLSASAPHASRSLAKGITVHTPAQGLTAADYARLPLSFEPNRGQFDSRFKFGSFGVESGVLLDSTGVRLRMRSGELAITMLGGNKNAKLTTQDELPGKANYFHG